MRFDASFRRHQRRTAVTAAAPDAIARWPRRSCCSWPRRSAARLLCRLRAVAALAGRAGVARRAGAADRGRRRQPFNIEPAAIRMPVQRRPGTQERVDLAYLWPSLTPPDPARRTDVGTPVDPNERLFVTIAGHATARCRRWSACETIYPRYLVAEPVAGPGADAARLPRRHALSGRRAGLRAGRARAFPRALLAHGVGNSGNCLLERRIGNADITFRFPRDWLGDWRKSRRHRR